MWPGAHEPEPLSLIRNLGANLSTVDLFLERVARDLWNDRIKEET